MDQEKKHVLYMSPRCKHCNSLVQIINSNSELASQFNIVNIHTQNIPPNIRTVPTVLVDKHKMACGRDAFTFVENERKLYLDAFEHGFGTNGFSYISNESALCENSTNFTYLTQDGFDTDHIKAEDYQTREQASSSKKSELEMLMEKRKAEIPQPIKRQ